MGAVRDLERTKEKILRAALSEFCAKGFAGARTAAIARRAGVNKRMIFYCFGSKENLYREILWRKIGESMRFFESEPTELVAALIRWAQKWRQEVNWIRLWEWEALERGVRPVVAEEARRECVKVVLEKLRRAQEEGRIPQGPDVDQLFLALVAVTVFPYTYPQLARLASGISPMSEEFATRQMKFLHWLGERLTCAGFEKTAEPNRTAKPQRRSEVDHTDKPAQSPV